MLFSEMLFWTGSTCVGRGRVQWAFSYNEQDFRRVALVTSPPQAPTSISGPIGARAMANLASVSVSSWELV